MKKASLGKNIYTAALLKIYKGWMSFAKRLAWINTQMLLTAIFFVIITPSGLLMRLFGRELLGTTSRREEQTVWKNCELCRKDHWLHMY